MMKSRLAFCFLALTIPTAAVYGQANSDAKTLQALLDEVRQLRLTLERSAVVAPKIQLTLQRMQLQQDQVTRLSRQLEDVRNQSTQFASEEAHIAAQLKVTEARAAEEQNAARRQAIEEDVKRFKAGLEQVAERQRLQEPQQRARESELAGKLQTEQNKLNELSEHLNVLERALEGSGKQQQN